MGSILFSVSQTGPLFKKINKQRGTYVLVLQPFRCTDCKYQIVILDNNLRKMGFIESIHS